MNNVIVDDGILINRFRQVRQEGNLVISSSSPQRPREPLVFVRPNRYDRQRAHVVIVNLFESTEVTIPLGDLAERGSRYAMYDPRHLFDQPVVEGRIEDETLRVPISGKFIVWVMKLENGTAE